VNTPKNAAEDDDREQQRPKGVGKRLAALAPGDPRIALETEPVGVDAQMHRRGGHDQGRQEARREQGGDRGIGDAAVDPHGQTGRHQDSHARRGGDDCSGMRPAVALPLHRLDHHRADRGGIGVGRARDAGKENHRD
jgi:hypothetical protein